MSSNNFVTHYTLYPFATLKIWQSTSIYHKPGVEKTAAVSQYHDSVLPNTLSEAQRSCTETKHLQNININSEICHAFTL